MYEEGVIKWENILTILIGVVIVAFLYLLLYRRRKIKRMRIDQEAALLKKDNRIQNANAKEQDNKDLSQ